MFSLSWHIHPTPPKKTSFIYANSVKSHVVVMMLLFIKKKNERKKERKKKEQQQLHWPWNKSGKIIGNKNKPTSGKNRAILLQIIQHWNVLTVPEHQQTQDAHTHIPYIYYNIPPVGSTFGNSSNTVVGAVTKHFSSMPNHLFACHLLKIWRR